jgi:hypothetical protein
MGARAARAWADSEGGKVPIEIKEEGGHLPLKPVEAASAASKVRQLLSGTEGKDNAAALDGFMMSKLNPLASEIVKMCLPGGLAVPFPANVSDKSFRVRSFSVTMNLTIESFRLLE